MKTNRLSRREFLGGACAIAALPRVFATRYVCLVVDPGDPVANSGAARWATSELEQILNARGVQVKRCSAIDQAGARDRCIIVSSSGSKTAAAILRAKDLRIAVSPEALALVPAKQNGREVIFACGSDERGVVYVLLELADRVGQSNSDTKSKTHDPLKLLSPVVEQPTNSIRSVLRLFASEVEDKPWFNDREMWPRYLTMLATQRFNRFNLSLSLGYDFLRRVTDAYFLFPYPFLFSVPGYSVHVPQLPDAERDRNLDTLKFISEQTVARGMQFQLGLWMHGYEWIDSPKANYTIAGLSAANHANYCRDALRLLLQSCPAIGGVTIRTHGESGVEEGSYDFWKTIFEGVGTCGRRVEIDLHPKGLDQTMLDNALNTRQPVTVSPKFWAEHLGLPYHQTDIRALEVPDPNKQTSRLMNLSEGSRSFMRYGYGDLLREDRTWKVIHRVWPGSQRLLLWGDARAAAAYTTAFTFCGSDGAEIMEPLTFKGRRGSGLAGDRCAYEDRTLRTRWDWEKYEYTYRVWGRLLYNPSADPDSHQRFLRKHFGPASSDLELALANASRILPLITTAHLPSAANNNYWPEMYVNHSLYDAENRGSYSDTPVPRVFGNVSPLDPQLFYRINDFADDLLNNERSGKYSPLEVAQWLDNYAANATKYLLDGTRKISNKQTPELRRLETDVHIQAGVGHFFAAKFRAAVLYRIFEKTGERAALAASLEQYRLARDHWAEFANRAKGVYLSDVTVGELPQLRGHWIDRLPAIDKEIDAIAKKLEAIKPVQSSARVEDLVKIVLGRIDRLELSAQHLAAKHFAPGKPLEIRLEIKPLLSAKLCYRHVNQGERFQVAQMNRAGSVYQAIIPGDYTNSNYPLQYYFELKTTSGESTIYPGFSPELLNQPYLVVRRG